MTHRLVPIVGVVCSLALGSWSATARAQWKEDKPANGSTNGGWGSGDKPVAQPSTGWGSPRDAQQPADSGHSHISIVYGPTKTQFGRDMEQGLRASGGFEKLAGALDSLFQMPRDLPIVMADCGVVNLFYDPEHHRIVVCYDFMEHLVNLAQEQKMNFKTQEELGAWIGSVTVFALFHEFGHALINELGLPSTGREEDAVDEFASLLLSQIGPPGANAALSGAGWFKLEDTSMRQHHVSNPYWDEHSFNLQRMVTVVCILLGSNPDRYKPIADSLDMPLERDQRCVADYVKKDKAWQTLLAPYLKQKR